ncbi:MAG: hypothetical protein JWM80_92 [Cyanobacteria bacterium RYN_339]|nr:hypothetical protein [Cyanobacteria bacterium RYN_339]
MDTFGFSGEADTADGVLAKAIERDVCGRLERAMHDDVVIARYLDQGAATVVVTVSIDRELAPAEEAFALPPADDAPYTQRIGPAAVAAIVAGIRRKVQAPGFRGADEPLVFDIVVNPDRVQLPA